MKFRKDNTLEILNEEQLDAIPAEPETVEEVVETVEEVVERVEAEIVTEGTVIANMLAVRSGPSKSYLPIGTLYKGDTIKYTVENDEWLKLMDRNGFVMKEFVQ